MTTQDWLWGADGAALAVAVLAGVAESRRSQPPRPRRYRLGAVARHPGRRFLRGAGADHPRAEGLGQALGNQARQLERGLPDRRGRSRRRRQKGRPGCRAGRPACGEADEQTAVEQVAGPAVRACCAGRPPRRRWRSSRRRRPSSRAAKASSSSSPADVADRGPEASVAQAARGEHRAHARRRRGRAAGSARPRPTPAPARSAEARGSSAEGFALCRPSRIIG